MGGVQKSDVKFGSSVELRIMNSFRHYRMFCSLYMKIIYCHLDKNEKCNLGTYAYG